MNQELPSLYDHQVTQKDAARAALAKHRAVVICANPGVGKTRMATVRVWAAGELYNVDRDWYLRLTHAMILAAQKGVLDTKLRGETWQP